ncbi:hypothetical protein CXF68_19690 [Tenacibaculum sp. Bg11-29]|uniref:DUF5723 family protein n=1 Tax=Tenacibaculum sp. Bg11-29 TaxID=2058306 RepID=UPI000C334DBB|nr:DUF5723 family protein [Tenacibaculum sp. Bg11-29]PKH52781.1 hypothetical protein CXF68_19690 [Tenacibaculum sp. Bg11-29]
MKKYITILFITGFFLSKICFSQNKQILYGFDKIPQTLLLNPGVNMNQKFHIGIPVLSGVSFQTGATGLTVADLFRDNNIDFTTKLFNLIDKVSADDYIQVHSQIEILNAGYELNKRDYLSFGFYTELDAFMSMPKDVLILLRDGNNAHLNKDFLLSEISFKTEAISVLHAGVSRKINKKFTTGARIKIYSGIVNATSTENTGSFKTALNKNNEYAHHLNNINAVIQSSGFYDENDKTVDRSDLIGRSLLGGNLGLGFDIGFTYKLDSQTEITASLLDIGFINYSKDVLNSEIKGDYTFSGIDFQYDGATNDYWQNLNNDFKNKVPSTKNRKSYSVMRPIKFNSSYKYSWGKSRNEESCSDMSYQKFYNNAVGVQLFSVFRPTGPKIALTSFYERKLSGKINTKVTYTIDDFSYANIGMGLSTKIGKVNVYGMLDNLLKINDIAKSNSVSFQFGINLIYN